MVCFRESQESGDSILITGAHQSINDISYGDWGAIAINCQSICFLSPIFLFVATPFAFTSKRTNGRNTHGKIVVLSIYDLPSVMDLLDHFCNNYHYQEQELMKKIG